MTIIGFGNLRKDAPNGIEFVNGKRLLYYRGEVAAEGVLDEKIAPRDYFYRLRFLDDFPEVSHWAFGDAWTQRLRIGRPQRVDADTLEGVVWFGDEDQVAVYRIERAYDVHGARAPHEMRPSAPWVTAPLPPLFDVPLNLPLRLIVGRAATAALDDDWPYETWQVVTSLVAREHVPAVLTTDIASTYGFRLRGLPMDLRRALCEVQGV
ncbi:MAG: hypothetical protein D6770_08035 [Anaerolineae bacterium]|nr:MAG: hypothetical protein D6770_08035 [Anaerolineae bacterium]